VNYAKPFPRYLDQPIDAEFQLIENTLLLDLNKDNIIFIDEVRVRIDWNVRTFYLKGEKNLRKVSSKKISLNCIGALAPNGNSYISFPERTNSFTMIKFILELLKENTTNKKTIHEINLLLNADNTNENLVKKEMQMELASKEKNLFQKIKNIEKLKTSFEEKKEKIDKIIRSFTISKRKLLYRLRKNQFNNIINSKLSKQFINTGIVWDNAKAHIANHVKDLLTFFGIKIAPLPIKSPEYNPIEYSWSDNKRETAKETIDSENKLKEYFRNEFYQLVKKNNYTNYWYNLIPEKRNCYRNQLEITITT
jgi:transposase